MQNSYVEVNQNVIDNLNNFRSKLMLKVSSTNCVLKLLKPLIQMFEEYIRTKFGENFLVSDPGLEGKLVKFPRNNEKHVFLYIQEQHPSEDSEERGSRTGMVEEESCFINAIQIQFLVLNSL